MLIRTESEAVAMIREANFEEYIRQAQNSSNWYSSLVKESEHEYRHFLLLHWCSRINGRNHFISPTTNACKIWEKHILDSVKYRKFCQGLIEGYIDYYPTYKVGSAEYMAGLREAEYLQKYYLSTFGFSHVYIRNTDVMSPPFPRMA
ncbi:hypothetical protein H6785_03355 [Candidatus Nomurabacteria bacterium]|nr:hypothetical protein [Candidatus Nomurabacteria bacterium]